MTKPTMSRGKSSDKKIIGSVVSIVLGDILYNL